MNQSTRLSVQKGGGCEKTEICDSLKGLNAVLMDNLIDEALMEWVEAHPDEMDKYDNADFIWKLFNKLKVIYTSFPL